MPAVRRAKRGGGDMRRVFGKNKTIVRAVTAVVLAAGASALALATVAPSASAST